MTTDRSQVTNPLRLAEAEERINGAIRLDSMARLKGLLLDYNGELHYELSFHIDESGRCIVDSEIDGSLSMECQRCLKPFIVEVQRHNMLAIVKSKDESDALPNQYEPLLLNDEVLMVNELIEDELLLAIPLSPLHPIAVCPGQAILEQINADAKPKPFAVLGSLKKTKSN